MKFDIQFDPPITNAAGTLGFAPDVNGWVDLTRLGGFFTNPVSWHSRSPSQSCCSVDYPGGFLIHSGVPNPGLRSTIRQHRMAWERSPIPVVVHLLCQELSEVRQMVSALEGLPGVSGLELGLPPNVTPLQAGSLVNEAIGELPVIVRLPFNRVVDLAPVIAAQFPLAAISLGPPRGKLPTSGEKTVHGRLYGPGLFAQAFQVLEEALSFELPVIAAGGVYTRQRVQWMLQAGALAVQLDSILWRNGLHDWTGAQPGMDRSCQV